MSFEKLHLVNELPHISKRQLPATFTKMKPPRDTILQTLGSNEHTKARHMLYPEPLPYQTQVFKSSTVTKMVQIPRRHDDPFNSSAPPFLKKKGVILHASRYAWDQMHRSDRLSQRDRLLIEKEEMDRARDLKRSSEIVSFREKYNLLLGGERIGALPLNDSQENIRPMADPSARRASDPRRSKGAGPSPPTVSASWDIPDSGRNPEEEPNITVAAQKSKLYGRSTSSVAGPDLGATPRPPPGTTGTAEDWKHVPRIPFPFYFGMASSAASTSEWDQYLARQQNNLRSVLQDVTKPSPNPTEQSSESRIQHYIMGGSKANMNERSNVIEELNFLKSLILPDFARDLYVGRGIKLPPTHATVKPRPTVPHPVSSKDGVVKKQKVTYEVLSPLQKKGKSSKDTNSRASDSPIKVPPSTAGSNLQQPLAPIGEVASRNPSFVEEILDENVPVPTSGDALTDPLQAIPAILSPEDEPHFQAQVQSSPLPSEGLQSFRQLYPWLPAHDRLSSEELRYLHWIFQLTRVVQHSVKEEEVKILMSLSRRISLIQGPAKESYTKLQPTTLYDNGPKLLSIFHSQIASKDAIQATALKDIFHEFLLTTDRQDEETAAALMKAAYEDLHMNEQTSVTPADYLTYLPYFIHWIDTHAMSSQQ